MAGIDTKFSKASAGELCVRNENDRWRPATGEEVIVAARAALARRVRRGTAMRSPTVARDFLVASLGSLEHEVFSALFLDTRHRLIDYRQLFRGTIDGATVYPCEAAKEALSLNSAVVIFAHNHPSGNLQPSEADRSITAKLEKDHLVVTPEAKVSFVERGLL